MLSESNDYCKHLPKAVIQICLIFFWYVKGYPRELLQLTVAGIPSMHICLDFISELIAQPQLDKQVVKCHVLTSKNATAKCQVYSS